MEGETDTLEKVFLSQDMETMEEDLIDINTDLGPNPTATRRDMKKSMSQLDSYGFLSSDPTGPISEHDLEVQDAIQNAVKKSPAKRKIAVQWPSISEKAVSEYGTK